MTTPALDIAADDLRALAALIERPPIDDVLLDHAVAVRSASAIRRVLAALASPDADRDGWQGIETFVGEGQKDRVLIAAGQIVGEAYLRRENDHDDGWWWAGTGPGDYYADPVDQTNDPVTHWRPLPAPPVALPHSVGPQDGEGAHP